ALRPVVAEILLERADEDSAKVRAIVHGADFCCTPQIARQLDGGFHRIAFGPLCRFAVGPLCRHDVQEFTHRSTSAARCMATSARRFFYTNTLICASGKPVKH